MRKDKIYIYHHNDHDGIVAAGILYNHLIESLHGVEDKNEIIFNMIDYDKELNFDHINFENCDEVYFLDYSFSNKHNLEEFKKLLDRRIDGDEVVWIDHHKTSIGVLEDRGISGIRNTSLCGAAWTYLWCNDLINDIIFTQSALLKSMKFSDTFHKDNDVPSFLKYIDDYDCWKKLYPETNDFHYGFNISDPTADIIHYLLYDVLSTEIIHGCIFTGKQVQNYLKFENKEYHVDMYGFEFTLPEEHGGLKCFCLNRKGNSIMFGDKINEYDAVIPFYFVNGKWKYSIFSNKENIDCSEVAKSYGGGGHKGAAGWVIDEFIF